MAETLPPELHTAIPGPRSRALASRLARVESRNVTALTPEPPIFWERATGANVWDVDGNRFVDLGAGFGVANVGHGHPHVLAALADQGRTLLHAMGDVHPPAAKVALLEALAARYPGGEPVRGVLASSGSDAVEIALKTALLATGRSGVIAFEGGYHGVTLGALDVTWRRDFREPFRERVAGRTSFARYGDVDDLARAAAACPAPVGAVIVEPVQGRGGDRVPPPGFLRALRERCDREGWLLIADEVYTGGGRTGRFFACEHEDVVPDLLCAGKGIAGGMPLSICLGRVGCMDAWPPSQGEALHTQTFLGHPASCAAALAALEVIDEEKLPQRAAELGALALATLREALRGRTSVREIRGLGLLIGIECAAPDVAQDACRTALARGVIAIPSGDDGRVISVTPPLVIGRDALVAALAQLAEAIG